MISYLSKLCVNDKKEYGSKACSFGTLHKNNIKIPHGFALSSKVFDEFMKFNSSSYSPSDYIEKNEEIQNFILNGCFPYEIEIEVLTHLKNISNGHINAKYAVRSSALCEDTGISSMAGMFSSYVNIDSPEEVIRSIKKCYASLFSDKALSSMLNAHSSFEELKMGIIIQVFIPGSLSGVIFSADITEMNSNTICINAVLGHCENYVSGKAPSSLYKLQKETKKELLRVETEGSPLLTSNDLKDLYDLALNIEKIFNSYQDIEWTAITGEIYILQARPITTFKQNNFKVNWVDIQDAGYNWWLGPPVPFPPLVLDICPLEEAAFSLGAYDTGYSERYVARTIQNGYIYFRKKEMSGHEEKRNRFLNQVDKLFEQGKNIFQDCIFPQLNGLINPLKNYLNKNLSISEIVKFLDLSIEYLKTSTKLHWPAETGTRFTEIFKNYCDEKIGSLSYKDFSDLIYKKSIITKERELLVRMVSHVKTDITLTNLFNTCFYDEILFAHLKSYIKGIELIQEIQYYLEYFGTCDAGYEGFIRPVLHEKPEGVIRKIRALLNIDVNTFIHSIEDIEKNKEALISLIVSKLKDDDKSEFVKKLEVAEKAFLVTDEHNYYIERQSWGYLRLAVIEAGKALKNAGLLTEEDDVFFMIINEIKDALQNKNIDYNSICHRKELFEQQKHMIAPRNIGKFTSPIKNSKKELTSDSSSILSGISTFNGIIRGRIICGIPQCIDEDCILVVYHGHASDITHLLKNVKGLIFENGSPFDHLGIIAKEMNIPAIYYVKNALSYLKNGDIVDIDGANEIIVKISS